MLSCNAVLLTPNKTLDFGPADICHTTLMCPQRPRDVKSQELAPFRCFVLHPEPYRPDRAASPPSADLPICALDSQRRGLNHPLPNFTQVGSLIKRHPRSSTFPTPARLRYCLARGIYSCPSFLPVELTEKQQFQFPACVPLIPAELPFDLVVDPPGFLRLLAEATRHYGFQGHSFSFKKKQHTLRVCPPLLVHSDVRFVGVKKKQRPMRAK